MQIEGFDIFVSGCLYFISKYILQVDDKINMGVNSYKRFVSEICVFIGEFRKCKYLIGYYERKFRIL